MQFLLTYWINKLILPNSENRFFNSLRLETPVPRHSFFNLQMRPILIYVIFFRWKLGKSILPLLGFNIGCVHGIADNNPKFSLLVNVLTELNAFQLHIRVSSTTKLFLIFTFHALKNVLKIVWNRMTPKWTRCKLYTQCQCWKSEK